MTIAHSLRLSCDLDPNRTAKALAMMGRHIGLHCAEVGRLRRGCLLGGSRCSHRVVRCDFPADLHVQVALALEVEASEAVCGLAACCAAGS